MKDIGIIGGGPGGLNAALYASRSGLTSIIFEPGLIGGQLHNTHEVENYLGFESISGFELAQKMENHIRKQKNIDIITEKVEKIEKIENHYNIQTNKANYLFKTIIIATGTTPNQTGIQAEIDYQGKGVSYCAVCDGNFFRNKQVVVIGGGDSALEEAEYLANIVDKVTIIHRRDEFRAQKIIQERVLKNNKIDILFDNVLENIKGQNIVEEVIVKNVKTNEITTIKAQGIFVYVGLKANNSFLPNDVTLKDGFIKINSQYETNLKGLYAIGDITDKKLRQIITAVSDGASAAIRIFEYIKENFE